MKKKILAEIDRRIKLKMAIKPDSSWDNFEYNAAQNKIRELQSLRKFISKLK